MTPNIQRDKSFKFDEATNYIKIFQITEKRRPRCSGRDRRFGVNSCDKQKSKRVDSAPVNNKNVVFTTHSRGNILFTIDQ